MPEPNENVNTKSTQVWKPLYSRQLIPHLFFCQALAHIRIMEVRALAVCLVLGGCGEMIYSTRRDRMIQEQQEKNYRRAAYEEEMARRREARNAAVREENAKIEAENAKKEAEVIASAKKSGFAGVDFKHGLIGTIGGIAQGKLPIDAARRLLVWLHDNDDDWRAFQVVSQNAVLFEHPSTETIVWLQNYKKDRGNTTWLEGAKLRGHDFAYVIIKGVKTYGSLLGSRQAIVIEADF
jgi:hypothetical protein